MKWPRGLRRGSAADCLLGLRVRIPPGACMSVVSILSCQVEVSATGWLLVQRSPTECVCVCVFVCVCVCVSASVIKCNNNLYTAISR
jgi:hypothetical protein